MKTVTYEEFLDFGPCWLGTEEGRKRLRKYKAWWGDGKTVLDILSLEKVDAEDRLWTVLRPAFIEDNILHEFACRCAERALSHVDNPDPRSVAAIEAKRAWLRGEISYDELYATWDAAWGVVECAVWPVAQSIAAAQVAAQSAAQSATQDTAQDAAWSAAKSAAWVAVWSAAQSAVGGTTKDTARQEERQWQVNELARMLNSELS